MWLHQTCSPALIGGYVLACVFTGLMSHPLAHLNSHYEQTSGPGWEHTVLYRHDSRRSYGEDMETLCLSGTPDNHPLQPSHTAQPVRSTGLPRDCHRRDSTVCYLTYLCLSLSHIVLLLLERSFSYLTSSIVTLLWLMSSATKNKHRVYVSVSPLLFHAVLRCLSRNWSRAAT